MLERADGIGRPDNSDTEASYQPVIISPRKDTDQSFEFQPFNPSNISQEEFVVIPGEIQEFSLKHLIKAEDTESLNRLRGDMQWDRDPSRYEIDLTRAINDITQREEPIKDESSGDSLYSFIRTYVNYSEPDLARKLESERIRRIDQPDFMFYSWEFIGGYDPAIRYRILLEDKVEQEIEEERKASKREALEKARRKEYDLEQERIDRLRVATIRPDLTSISGGLEVDAA